VIALVAVGQGAQAQVVSQFQSLGANLLTVTAGTSFGFSRSGLQQNVRQLTNADVEAIRGLATAVGLVAPEYSAGNVTVSYGGKTASPSVTGVTAEYATVRNWSLARGRFISAEDNDKLAMAVVLGQTAVQDLFGSTQVNPIGETIRKRLHRPQSDRHPEPCVEPVETTVEQTTGTFTTLPGSIAAISLLVGGTCVEPVETSVS
jgi:putative ABC transport system permease protein